MFIRQIYQPALKSLNKGAVAWWPFDLDELDNSGNMNNALLPGSGNPGIVGGRAPAAGLDPPMAKSFDGISNYLTVPNSSSLNFNTAWSYACWVYYLGAGLGNGILFYRETGATPVQGTYAAVVIAASGKFTLSMNQGSGWGDKIVSNGVVPQNRWTHLAGTWDGTTATLIMNGVIDKQTGVTGSLGAVTAALSIGRESSQANEFFKGYIDDLRLWNICVPYPDIFALYAEAFQPLNGIERISLFKKVTAPVVSVHFRKTASRIGTRAGTRQTWAA